MEEKCIEGFAFLCDVCYMGMFYVMHSLMSDQLWRLTVFTRVYSC